MIELPEPTAESSTSRLSALPPELRRNPLFRQGYNRGYSDRAHEEYLTQGRVDKSPAESNVTLSTAIFDVTTGGLKHRLAPGVRVIRDLSRQTAQHFVTKTPCCGRGIMLATPEPDQTRPAVCCNCGVIFAVGLIREEPDGYGDEPPWVAIFVVEQLDVAVALHRKGKWEH